MAEILLDDSTQRLVTIGVPVYNGGADFEAAMASLLDQDYPSVEIAISDNASQDGTADVCRRLAATNPNLRYHRNTRNIGAMENFFRLVDQARGAYFMWAAHDDLWPANYVSELVRGLEAAPGAVLVTPAAIHITAEGSLGYGRLDRPASGRSTLADIRRLFDDHATCWFYGLFRTHWLRAHYAEMRRYPASGCDLVWLFSVCLRERLAGREGAVIFKRRRGDSWEAHSVRSLLRFYTELLWHLTRVSLIHARSLRASMAALALAWLYVARHPRWRPRLAPDHAIFAGSTALPEGICPGD